MEYESALVRFKEVLRDCLNLEVEIEEEEELIEQGKGSNSFIEEKKDVMNNLVKKFHATNLHAEVPHSN